MSDELMGRRGRFGPLGKEDKMRSLYTFLIRLGIPKRTVIAPSRMLMYMRWAVSDQIMRLTDYPRYLRERTDYLRLHHG
jgi:hypothetical protein